MDDFFSNGFFKFFNETDEEIISWQDDYSDYQSTSSLLSDNYYCNQNQCHQNVIYNNNDDSNYLTNQVVVSYDSDYDLVFSELKNWQQSSIISETVENQLSPIFDNSDWEKNIETLLFDNSIEFTNNELTSTYHHLQQTTTTSANLLPDKTALCSDSCTIFLKESSENLYTNLQSFSIKPSQTISSVTNLNETLYKSDSSKSSDTLTTTATDKMFPCTFIGCVKIYAKAAHLKAHLRRHIGDKPYVCTWPECTWKFSRSDELARHRRSHSGIKPYKCIYCTKCFSRSDHLSKHRKVHERKMSMASNKMKNCSRKAIVLK